MAIQKVMVVGAGQMGSGIVQSIATAGLQAVMYDISREMLQNGIAVVNKNLLRDVEKGRRSTEDVHDIVGRIIQSNSIADAANVDVVIEAISENMDLKAKVFSELDKICQSHTILASNTSSLSITALGAATSRPHKVIGMHFMNPVPIMSLIEVIRGLATSDETYEASCTLSRQMGKTPIEAGDYPGFVSNRVLMPMINEAIFCVYEGVAAPHSVDQMMKLGMNHPMGPLALADLIGLDTCLSIMEVLQQGFGDSKYRPCPLLRQYVHAGWLGRKSGRGFYIYE